MQFNRRLSMSQVSDTLHEDEVIKVDGDNNFYGLTLSEFFALLNCVPPVPGTQWVVTKAVYDHFYDILPPLPYSNGYAMREFSHANVTLAFWQKDGFIWSGWVEYCRN
ncbi:hypothetical protein HLB25_21365 [Dickeya dadantii]|uniref:hypothetical protein n=1 Tax=Dickeya dadantii TaxID=204038 RepID=UPI001495C0F8|nr:hypothetical protein [Dickeya dadantii]NPE57287.1 hypothetical protein [Dickeya dadantii]NPE69058.1 hypothetical protein [Dickeya dadantii]